MVKANELKIGNLVQLTAKEINKYLTKKPVKYQEVENIYDFGINISPGYEGTADAEFDMDGIEGIPLTPEILIKAGFKKVGRYAIGGGSYHIYQKGKIEFLMIKDPGEYTLAFYETIIKHVHQLQNLYFALTGTELEIKL